MREVYILAYNGFLCLFLFFLFSVISFFTSKLVWLFRLSVITAFHAFYFEVFFTGGALSPALAEFIIPPIIAFFYKPVRDRYYFMFFAVLCALSIWVLSALGYTKNYFPQEHAMEMHVISAFFVFLIVGFYIYLYRKSLSDKNKELKSSYQKLIESEKMASLGLLSAGVAHEINNPLNFIKGGVEMLSLELEESEDTTPYLNAIEEGVRRATSIVNSLSHFSRDTPSMDEECDINAILDNCLIMLNHKLKYSIEVEKDFSDLSHIRLIGNEGQLHQAMLNIISNATEAIPESGTIRIHTYYVDQKLMVLISDTGRGIEPDHLSKIRDPFFTTKSAGEGTGLGLSIAYKVIESHSGWVSVESVLGKGTSFKITFKNPQVISHE